MGARSPFRFLRGALFLLLGRMLARRGSPSIAAICFREAAYFEPTARSALFQQARGWWDCQEYDKARDTIEMLLRIAPEHPEANNLRGALLLNDQRPNEALVYINRALAADPAFAAAHNNLGNVYLAELDLKKAEGAYRQALRYRPDYVEALTNLGETLNRLGNYEDAERYCRQAIAIAPDYAGAYCNLGNVLLNRACLGEAVAAYREALRLRPDMAAAHINLAIALGEPAYLAGAIEYYEKLLKHDASDYLSYVRIGQGLQALGRYEEAERRFLAAKELRGQAPDVLCLLGNNLIQQGDAAGAVRYFRQVVAAGPHPGAQECLAFTSIYVDDTSGTQLLEEARHWASYSASTPAHTHAYKQQPLGAPFKLRIGYVSRDFGFHSVSFFFEPVLRLHNREFFEIYCYANVISPDFVTERLKGLADAWRDVATLSDQKAAQLIHDDRIDVLIDLSGHTTGNRLGIFRLKPAPLQITYLGHPGTTGLNEINYKLSDAIADPVGATDGHYSEIVWRLPRCFLTYQPIESAPPVSVPPSDALGFVTFGSFNNAVKIGGNAVRCWAGILRRVPGSRLVLKSHCFSSENGRSRVAHLLTNQGISPDRFDLIAWLPDCVSHLEAYARIDIALDTFPYNGTTTTCEALWMGVPVITLAGDRHSCRVGASLLHCVGLDEFVCESVDAYMDTAAALAENCNRLAKLRAALRERMRTSPLLDSSGFVRDLEDAYREMWAREADQGAFLPEEARLDATGNQGDVLRIHVGGIEPKAGWKILNVVPSTHTDYVGTIQDLTRFENNSVAEVYASHVLEHVGLGEILDVLKGIYRILRTSGGKLMISVPDLEVLCRHFLSDSGGKQSRNHVMRMMFGGQTDPHDFHKIGLYFELLAELLATAGFREIRRVESFDLFADTSEYAPYGEKISLNVVAFK